MTGLEGDKLQIDKRKGIIVPFANLSSTAEKMAHWLLENITSSMSCCPHSIKINANLS